MLKQTENGRYIGWRKKMSGEYQSIIPNSHEATFILKSNTPSFLKWIKNHKQINSPEEHPKIYGLLNGRKWIERRSSTRSHNHGRKPKSCRNSIDNAIFGIGLMPKTIFSNALVKEGVKAPNQLSQHPLSQSSQGMQGSTPY
jgi:hypothetical protein